MKLSMENKYMSRREINKTTVKIDLRLASLVSGGCIFN